MSDPFGFIGDAWDATTGFAGDVVVGVESSVCNVWKAVLPDGVENALRMTTRNPWRSMWRGGNFLVASYAPFALMPITFPLAILFYPILIWLETIRIAWAIFANCGSVTRTLQNESKDLLDLLDFLSPNTPQGRTLRTVVTLAGASGLLDSYDTMGPPLRAFLTPVSRGTVPDPSTFVALAATTADLSGPDTPYTKVATSSKDSLVEVEKRLGAELEKVDGLSSEAVFTASGVPKKARLVLSTSPPTETGTELAEIFTPSRSVVAVGAVAATLGGLLYFTTRKATK